MAQPTVARQDSEGARLSVTPHLVALFDFQAESADELSLRKGEYVFVEASHAKDAASHDDGWVWCRKRPPSVAAAAVQTQGYVPHDNLEHVPCTKGEDGKPATHEVKHPFTAESGEEMSVEQGDKLNVIGALETDNGWVFCKKVPKPVEGYVPKSFLSASSPVAQGSANEDAAGATASQAAAHERDTAARDRKSSRDSFAHVRKSQQHGVCSNCCGKGCGVFLDSIAVEDNGIDTQRAVCCKLGSLFLQLFIICSPAAFAPIALFSRIGWGTSVFTALADTGSGWWWLLFGGGLAILLLLYVLDFSYWEGNWLCVKRLLVAVALREPSLMRTLSRR